MIGGKMKKLFLFIITLTLAIPFMLGGCGYQPNEDYLPEYESGYYKYAVRTLEDGTQKAYLIGLTDFGKEQTELVYPEEIDGIPVYGIGYDRKIFMGYERIGYIGSENLNKVYFPAMPKENDNAQGGYLICNYSVRWEISERTNMTLNGDRGEIWGYNYLIEANLQFLSYDKDFNRFISNISYFYNYENSPNKGCYWVDSYDESVVTFIPPDPEREGYSFGGWFKEQECINEWDFKKDITGKEIRLSPHYATTEYDIKNLYAKWINN